ncbi:MAG: hypothetical protein IT292_01640 [Deltaproteobacteria bacterium]|nr:hypothetical protein [Deltaproteobacteria bacterium]
MSLRSIAATYCVYDDEEWLPYSYQAIYPEVQAIYFFVDSRPWFGEVTDNYSMLQCIEDLPDPQNKKILVRGNWGSEVVQRNAALDRLSVDGFAYNFIIDADEIYDTLMLGKMFEYAYAHGDIECWHTCFVNYWKSPRYRIDPMEKHNPPILLKVGTGRFLEYRNCRSGKHELFPPTIGYCHHFSYARTDIQIIRKLNTFSHAQQIGETWYENVWKKWDEDHSIRDLCPYNPGAFDHAVEVPEEVWPQIVKENWEKIKTSFGFH